MRLLFMNEKITQLLDECLKNASKEDLSVLSQVLEGIVNKQKHEKDQSSYIKDLFQMKHHFQDEEVEITMPITPITFNHFSIVHGGITATLLDTAMGGLANMVLPKGQKAVTSNLNIHYIAPGAGSFIKAKVKIIHRGSNTMVMEGLAYRDDGVQIAHCTSSFFIIKH